MLTQSSHIIKARQWPVLFLFLIMGGPFLVALNIDPADITLRWFLVFVMLFCITFYLINSKHYLYLDNQILVYKTVLSKKERNWEDIVRSDIGWSVEGTHSASINWKFETKHNKQLEIRLGYFSRADMQILAQQLIDRAPHAQFSKKIYQFAEGKFPWYLV